MLLPLPHPARHPGSGSQLHPPGLHTSHANGNPQHVVTGGQSAGFTVPGGHTHAPSTHPASSGK
jgi:hypothetical protein